MADTLHTYTLYWSPEGRPIAIVQATTGWEARKMAPQPYRRYIGEIYSVRRDMETPTETAAWERIS